MANKHGGKRKGAGRPPTMQNGKRHNVYLPDNVWNWLRRNGDASAEIQRIAEKDRKDNL